MKIKSVTVTKAEVKALLEANLDLDSGSIEDVVFEGNQSNQSIFTGVFAANCIEKALIACGYPQVDRKIACIKLVREMLPGFGLVDAKWIVENFHTFLRFLIDNNRLPDSGFGYSRELK